MGGGRGEGGRWEFEQGGKWKEIWTIMQQCMIFCNQKGRKCEEAKDKRGRSQEYKVRNKGVLEISLTSQWFPSMILQNFEFHPCLPLNWKLYFGFLLPRRSRLFTVPYFSMRLLRCSVSHH